MSSELWWYTARAAGIVSWCLLAAGMVWGLLLSTKARIPGAGRRPRPNWVLDLHRFLGAATIVFSTIHVLAIVADSYVDFGAVQVLVPFTSSWRPAAVAWGIVSAYLLVAVEVTSLLRTRLSKRAWHLTHLLSFPIFLFSTVHVLTAGTDATSWPLRAALLLGTTAVVALTAWRTVGFARPEPTTPRPRVPARPSAPAPIDLRPGGSVASTVDPVDRPAVGSAVGSTVGSTAGPTSEVGATTQPVPSRL